MAATVGRWLRLGAMASALLVVVVLAGCTPSSNPPVPPRPAPTVRASEAVSDHHYEYTVVREHWLILTERATRVEELRRVRHTWRAADGWSWVRQTGDGAGVGIIRPRPRLFAVTDVPPDPAALEAYLRTKLTRSDSAEAALFNYVSDLFAAQDLPDGGVPAEYRSALVRMLGRLDGVTIVPNSPDPEGRLAIRVKYADESVRTAQSQSLYLDPANNQLLAIAFSLSGTRQGGSSVIVRRDIVGQLPEDLAAELGTQRVQRFIQQ